MKRTGLAIVLLALAGCSTAPLADFLDFVAPGRIPKKGGEPYGGVCQPQGGTPGAPGVPGGGVIPPPAAPGAGVIPPPAGVNPTPPGGGVIPPPQEPGFLPPPPPPPPAGSGLPEPFPTGK
jgi:formin 2